MNHKLEQVAIRAARKYKRRCWWACMDDLHQEARVAVIEAERTFDPEVGVPVEGYAYRAAMLALRTYTWKQSAPVSASDHTLESLRGVYHGQLEDVHVDGGIAPDEDTELRRWHLRVRARIAGVLGEGEAGLLALRVLLGEAQPADVAREAEVPVAKVYAATLRARKAISEDLILYRLWKEQWNEDEEE